MSEFRSEWKGTSWFQASVNAYAQYRLLAKSVETSGKREASTDLHHCSRCRCHWDGLLYFSSGGFRPVCSRTGSRGFYLNCPRRAQTSSRRDHCQISHFALSVQEMEKGIIVEVAPETKYWGMFLVFYRLTAHARHMETGCSLRAIRSGCDVMARRGGQ